MDEPVPDSTASSTDPASASSVVRRSAWVGEGVLLPCVARGHPTPESTWFRGDPSGGSLRQVLPGPRVKYHLEVLILLDLLVEDSGTYVCIANNTVGSRRVHVELTVRSPLETRVTPARQTVDLERPAAFECAVLGHPVKEIAWLKNGRQVEKGHR